MYKIHNASLLHMCTRIRSLYGEVREHMILVLPALISVFQVAISLSPVPSLHEEILAVPRFMPLCVQHLYQPNQLHVTSTPPQPDPASTQQRGGWRYLHARCDRGQDSWLTLLCCHCHLDIFSNPLKKITSIIIKSIYNTITWPGVVVTHLEALSCPFDRSSSQRDGQHHRPATGGCDQPFFYSWTLWWALNRIIGIWNKDVSRDVLPSGCCCKFGLPYSSTLRSRGLLPTAPCNLSLSSHLPYCSF